MRICSTSLINHVFIECHVLCGFVGNCIFFLCFFYECLWCEGRVASFDQRVLTKFFLAILAEFSLKCPQSAASLIKWGGGSRHGPTPTAPTTDVTRPFPLSVLCRSKPAVWRAGCRILWLVCPGLGKDGPQRDGSHRVPPPRSSPRGSGTSTDAGAVGHSATRHCFCHLAHAGRFFVRVVGGVRLSGHHGKGFLGPLPRWVRSCLPHGSGDSVV